MHVQCARQMRVIDNLSSFRVTPELLTFLVTREICENVGSCQNFGLLKRMQDKVSELNAEQKLVFIHCIIHQQALCKSVLKFSHVVDVVATTVIFIRARALNHRQFVSLLEEQESEHNDVRSHSCQMAQPGQSAEKVLGTEIRDKRVL